MLSNEVSKRLTASMVGFSGKERKLGEAALSGVRSRATRHSLSHISHTPSPSDTGSQCHQLSCSEQCRHTSVARTAEHCRSGAGHLWSSSASA